MTFVHQISPADHKTRFMPNMERIMSTRTTDPAKLASGVSYADGIYHSPERGNVVVGEEIVDNGGVRNVTRTVNSDRLDMKCQEYKSVEHFDSNTGKYSVERMKVTHKPCSTDIASKKVISSYEMNLNEALPDRKFASGFKGKLQKLALKIGTDANGCERPIMQKRVIQKVVDFAFNTTKSIK